MKQIAQNLIILELAEKIYLDQIRWRRHLHQYPEIAFEEKLTTKYLRQELIKLGLKPKPLKMPTGLIVDLKSGRPGKMIAIRTDIDALPLLEKSPVKFQSKHPGCMHACGHDVHMACILGAATILKELKSSFTGSVRFLFQPAEEQPPGGARPMIAAGALAGVERILGLHVDPHLPVGQISLRDGVTMASVYDFDITVIGRAGHAARPHTAVDAIATAAELVDSLQKIISREIDPVSPVALTIGKIIGGTARNVIAENVTITGTARALSEKTAKALPALIKKTTAGICRARSAKFEIKSIASYPVLANDPGTNQLFRASFKALYPKRKIGLTEPVLGGEDFACYLEKIDGAMFRLGIMNRKIGADKPWHATDFMVDETAMKTASALLAATAIEALSK